MPPAFLKSPTTNNPRSLPRAERVLLGVIAAHLAFLPWALGDTRAWSQAASGALSAASLAIALYWPRAAPDRRRLARFPVFWIGAALLLYILVQALNPAWLYQRAGARWWIAPLPHAAWLPHGMRTPFAIANPWRSLLIYGSAWLTACAIWAGFTSRRAIRLLLALLAANACALAILGIVEQALGARRIFWSWTPPTAYFVSSFIYKNHAGAFFALMLAVAIALGVWQYSRGHRSRQGVSKLAPYAAFATGISFIIVLSNSRAALVLMVLFLLGAPALLYASGALFSSSPRRRTALAAVYGGLILAAAVGLFWLRAEPVLGRLETLAHGSGASPVTFRVTATRATLDMFRSDPVYGWGAGGFRFAFPLFQGRYPAIIFGGDGRLLYWEHAHDDWAEYLAEFGLAGGILLAALPASMAVLLIRRRFWKNPCLLLLVAGCCLTLLHAFADFPFHNPAILLTWWAVLAAAVRWAQIDARNAADASADQRGTSRSNRAESSSPAVLG